MTKKFLQFIQHLQIYGKKWWYPPLLGFLAAIDHYIVIIPVDGLLASSALLNPRRWLTLVFFFTIGSTLGVLGYIWILHAIGVDRLVGLFPSLFQSSAWSWTEQFFEKHGSWVVLVSGMSPLPQQPAVIITALAQISFWTIAGMLLIGRLIKFMLIGYISSYAPQKLSKLWGIQHELQEMHVPLTDALVVTEKPVENSKESST